MNNSMNNNGMQNQNTNGNPQQQQINLQNIPPQQLAQLVTAMRTAYDQAKNSTNDSERQQHFNRAENIRRLLARYQAQKNRLQQQAQQQLAQQQQQQQLLQQQVQQQQQQKQQQTLTEHQQQIQAVQAQAQALAQMNNVNNNFNQMNNVNSNQVGTPLMQLQSPNPSLQSPMIQSRQVNMGTPMRQQSPLMQQQSPNMSQFSTQQLQGTPQPQQTPQPNNMFGNMNQTASSNMNAGTMNRNPLANNITMERLAQVKQKLTEVQQKVQLLEQSKKSNNITPEQIQMIDKEILENKTKFQQYQKVGMYIRSQLVLQAKAQRQKQLEQQQLQQNNNHGLLHQQPPQQMQNNQQQQQQQLQSQIQQGQAQINQQRKFSPQLQAAQQQQQSQQQQQFLNNQQRTQSNNNMMQMQSQAPTPMPVRLTPQMQHNPVPSNMPSQAPTPAFPASQPTPSINGPASVPPPVSAPIQQQQPPPPPPQQQQQQQEQPHPQPQPQPQPHQRVPSRQASATPQAHFQQQQQIDKSHLPTNTAQEKVNQQRQSTASTSAHGTPAQNNGATITKSPSVANVASGTAARTVSGDASGPATGRGTPQQRPRSSMSLNLAGITRQPVPSIPINNSINVKPPTVTTFNSAHDGRPTLTGGAANSLSILLDSPAITKLPTFDIEGDTSSIDANTTGRVFNKRKLSDLISTIGVDEGDGKTNIDGNVEELLLDLADEFIHSVTSFACRLAKHRKVDSIEAKDIQLHLDKNWNIKIPGYAMDEIRSTRKVQPSNSYNQKVQGVEVSKAVNDDISNA